MRAQHLGCLSCSATDTALIVLKSGAALWTWAPFGADNTNGSSLSWTKPVKSCETKAGVIPLHDLTEARRTAETVTAEEVFNLGHAKGIEDERNKVLDLLGAQEFASSTEDERDLIWMLRAIIKSAGHWQDKP